MRTDAGGAETAGAGSARGGRIGVGGEGGKELVGTSGAATCGSGGTLAPAAAVQP